MGYVIGIVCSALLAGIITTLYSWKDFKNKLLI
jgi:hypothetical protein